MGVFRKQRWIPLAVLALLSFAPLFASEPAAAQTAHKIFRWRPFLAPFHAVALHCPIGFLTAAFILETYRWFRPSDELRRAISLILWASLLSGIVAATFGIMRAEGGGYDSAALSHHRTFGFLVLGFTLATAILQALSVAGKTLLWTFAYRSVFVSTLGLLVVAGHLGGNLTHGSKYLIENAPGFMRQLLEGDFVESPARSLGQSEQFYVEKVQPIFASKCYNCHGPVKRKGGFRLDLAESALKGGESGEPAIKAGDPIKSRLVQLLLLPPDHADVMPPDGKKPLSPEELGIVIEWIRDGAHFPTTPRISGSKGPLSLTLSASPHSAVREDSRFIGGLEMDIVSHDLKKFFGCRSRLKEERLRASASFDALDCPHAASVASCAMFNSQGKYLSFYKVLSCFA